MRPITGYPIAFTVVLLLALVAGCKDTVTIKTLLDDPSQYDRKTVRIAGTVTNSVGVLGYGAYRVDDGTGTLTIVSKEGGAPREGARVGVEGEFRTAFNVGNETLAVLIEKRRGVE